MKESYCPGGSQGMQPRSSSSPAAAGTHPVPLSPRGRDQQSWPEPSFPFKVNCFFSTQTIFAFHCSHSFDSTIILTSPWGSESDALLVVNSRHERIIINAIIKLITNVKKQLFNKTYFTRLKLSERPRDIYMFWSGKECKITLRTANHTRYEQLTAPNKEVLEGSKIPEWQREERQSPTHHREFLESGTKHWKVPVYTKWTLLLWPVLHRHDRLSFWLTGMGGLIHVLSFCKKPSKDLWECMKNQAKYWFEYEKWNPSAEGRGKGLWGQSILKSKGT